VTSLCFHSARELAHLIATRHVSAREVMQAHLDQIHRLNPRLNAIVSLLPDDECLALADAADRRVARRDEIGPLHGLPIAFKDLQPAVGFPFTRGSPIFKDDRPSADSVLVERLRIAGVIPIGKTNVPEFGMGSHTYNRVFGTTVNPYDLTKSAGGSSGGAGASLAAGMLPIADGTDFGGSLRQPGQLQQRRRAAADRRPRAERTGCAAAAWLQREWPDGAFGRRCRVAVEHDGRSRRARPPVLTVGPFDSLPSRSAAISPVFAWRGVPISEGFLSILVCARCSRASVTRSSRSAASSKTRVRISATSTFCS
jgi:hypothetical protein